MTDRPHDTAAPTGDDAPDAGAQGKSRSPLMRAAVWGFRLFTVALIVLIAQQVQIRDSIETVDGRLLEGRITQEGQAPADGRNGVPWVIEVTGEDGQPRLETLTWRQIARRDRVELANGTVLTGTVLPPAPLPEATDASVVPAPPLRLRLPGGTIRDIPRGQLAGEPAIGRPLVTRGLGTLVWELQIGTMLVAVLGVLVVLLLVGLRWWILARSVGVDISLWDAVRLMGIGQFYMYAPGGITTGDLIKALYLRRHTKKTTEALVSVFADRVLGLQTMLLMGLIAILVFGWQLVADIPGFRYVLIVIVALAGAMTLLGLALVSRRTRSLLQLKKLVGRGRIAHMVDDISASLAPYRGARKQVVVAGLFSIGSQVVQALLAAMFGAQLGIDVPLWQYFVLIPVVSVIGAIPGLPGGLGLMETGYVGFFAFTLSPDELSRALALSLLMRAALMIMSALGLYWALTFGRAVRKAEARREARDTNGEAGPAASVQPAGQ